ncbi:MAG: hypothetical protein KAS32_22175 [Candidatus Peribacteraceae bacterium]|nr:hypothetical protein [Candidatus Peribacteraceae bacterium]
MDIILDEAKKLTGLIQYGEEPKKEKLFIGEYTLGTPVDLWGLWGYPGRIENAMKKRKVNYAQIFIMSQDKCYGSFTFDTTKIPMPDEMHAEFMKAAEEVEKGGLGSYID